MIAAIRKKGFSLVEVTIALGIVTFGIVTLFALLPVGLRLVRESTDESIATGIMTMVAAELTAELGNTNRTPRFGIDFPFEAGERVGVLTNGVDGLLFAENGLYLSNGTRPEARFEASYAIRGATNSLPPNALVMVTWPAQSSSPQGRVETLVALPATSVEP